jgi:mono/diheme cytochrome c family protein
MTATRCVPVLGFGLLVAGLSWGEGVTPTPAAPARPARYNQDVRPILSGRCFKCHGPDQKKGGLDLTTRETALLKLPDGQAIVPGKSGASLMIERVCATDDGERMPPVGDRLTDAQVATLRAWIDQGAKYEEHWAYVHPRKQPPPAVKNPGWCRNPIDSFVLARLEQEGLAPSPEADRATLIRRLSLDLTGLPPTPQEVDAFLADTSPNAYEKVVDRLLGSLHYGERQARPWLDLARYADTNGYEKDDRRTIWPYRDWVIHALNADMPFDRFTIEQLAGDLLPNATTEQKIATGFHRNTMVNTEGGTDPEEFRVAAVVDRVNTTMEVWTGTTFGCAQCHNHKFDPFTTKEYYRLYAFFNGTVDHGGSNDPQLPVYSPEQTARLERLRADIAPLQKLLDTPTPELAAAQAKWEKAQSAAVWVPLTVVEATARSGATLKVQKDGSVLVSGKPADTDLYVLQATTDLAGVTGIRLEALPDPSLPGKGPGRAPNGNFVLGEFTVTASPKQGATAAVPVSFQHASADFFQADAAVNFSPAASLDGNPKTGWAIAPQMGQAHEAVFEARETVGQPGGTRFQVTLSQDYGGGHTLGKFRLSATTAARPVRAGSLPETIARLLAVPAEKRGPAQRDELAKHYRSVAPELADARKKLADLRRDEAAVKPPTTLVMQELPKPRPTNIQVRGNHLNKGEPVTPGVPARLHPLPPDAPPNRLGLARWLVSPENPLVGRVTMNRLWSQYFGRGLVETSEEFGTQGEPPTHPELLDWLAVEFVERGWSLKHMHKLVVMSATYRQASKVTPELVHRDPYNRLFARGPRFRLEAEMVRDNALAVSGLLSRTVGGPSVFPYQPDGVWANPYSGDRWQTSTGGDQHRRGLYTFWRRTAPYAAFVSFDAPSRENCTDRRPRTNTPLQALATLNDRVFVECSSALARRMLAEAKGDDAERAAYGFRLCVSRKPSDAELSLLLGLYRENLAKYRKDAAAAKAMATAGLPEIPKGADAAELAAWTVVANVLLNLDETITKG